MRSLSLAAAAFALFAAPAGAQSLVDTAAGAYSLEKNHAWLTFAISHNDLSDYIVNFTDFDATIDFNPEDPAASSVSVTINPASLETNFPKPEEKIEWENDLANDPAFFNTGAHPEITFVSTSVEKTGDNTGRVTGDLTFLGQTKPLTLDVVFNGTGNAPWFGERDLLGFNATTTIKRSSFGMTTLLPNIGDDVTVEFSGEFLQDE